MKVAVVGATGMVGRVMLDVLEEFDFPVSTLIPAASATSLIDEPATIPVPGDAGFISTLDALNFVNTSCGIVFPFRFT